MSELNRIEVSEQKQSVNADDVCGCGATAKELAERRESFTAGAVFYYFGKL